jgi:hypothetical protein
MVFKLLAFLVQEKNYYEVLLASLKTLINSKNCSESRIKFLFWFSFALIGRFLQCTFIVGFRNNFQDHRRVREQLLETQPAIRKTEEGL